MDGSGKEPRRVGGQMGKLANVQRAQLFEMLVHEGFADSLIEAAIRFVIGKREVATVLIGISDMEQLDQAAGYSAKGALPAEALDRLQQLWASYTAPAQP